LSKVCSARNQDNRWEIPMSENTARNYGEMSMNDVIETIIRDSKLQGTITYPLRTEGYHTCSNLLYTERLK